MSTVLFQTSGNPPSHFSMTCHTKNNLINLILHIWVTSLAPDLGVSQQAWHLPRERESEVGCEKRSKGMTTRQLTEFGFDSQGTRPVRSSIILKTSFLKIQQSQPQEHESCPLHKGGAGEVPISSPS